MQFLGVFLLIKDKMNYRFRKSTPSIFLNINIAVFFVNYYDPEIFWKIYSK